MKSFHDLSTTKKDNIENKAKKLGWSEQSYQIKRTYIAKNDLSKIKEKIRNADNSLTIFKGERGREKIRETTCLQGLDIIQNPGKNKRFRGVDKPSAQNANENDVIFLFTFNYLKEGSRKEKVRKLADFRQSIKVCRKYGAKYCIATGAETKNDLRSPDNLKRFISSAGGEPKKSLEKYPEDKFEEVLG